MTNITAKGEPTLKRAKEKAALTVLINARCRQVRVEAGNTMEEQAKLLGVSKQRVGQLETNLSDSLPAAHIVQLMYVLGVTPNEFLKPVLEAYSQYIEEGATESLEMLPLRLK
jgi:transcriptional regulator with XRE-family HTH domain